IVDGLGWVEAGLGGVRVLGAPPAPSRAPLEVGPQPFDPMLERARHRVVDPRLEPPKRRHLREPRAHRPGADDSDAFDHAFVTFVLPSACISTSTWTTWLGWVTSGALCAPDLIHR